MKTYKVEDKVSVYGGRIGIIEEVIYDMVDGKETSRIYCYRMKINGVSGYTVYPDEIDD